MNEVRDRPNVFERDDLYDCKPLKRLCRKRSVHCVSARAYLRAVFSHAFQSFTDAKCATSASMKTLTLADRLRWLG